MSNPRVSESAIAAIRSRWEPMRGVMDERARRLWAASEAMVIGVGGITAVHQATGLAIDTIRSGIRELREGDAAPAKRARREGGGRKRLRDSDETLLRDLDRLIEPTTRGDPMSPLRWTCKSVRRLASELAAMGHRISQETVCQILHDMGYSLQANSKTTEGSSHPDRDAQFAFINETAKQYMLDEQPVISVDTKKKELIGPYKNGGVEWRPHGQPEAVRVHDFIDPDQGKAVPYGVYDLNNNVGWVSVGVDHDTAEFAINTIHTWWRQMGRIAYPEARKLMITADAGGSNGYRSRAWKEGLQRLSNATGLTIQVCHYPPGTSKWNKIEHRLFSFITQNWRARPLVTHEAVVNLIANTRTQTGLAIQAQLDPKAYPLGHKVTDQQMRLLNIESADFHGEWNYKVAPTIQWYN